MFVTRRTSGGNSLWFSIQLARACHTLPSKSGEFKSSSDAVELFFLFTHCLWNLFATFYLPTLTLSMANKLIWGGMIMVHSEHTGVGKSRFSVVSTWNGLFFYYYLLVNALFICITTVKLLLLTPYISNAYIHVYICVLCIHLYTHTYILCLHMYTYMCAFFLLSFLLNTWGGKTAGKP